MPTYYDVLGVSPASEPEAIEGAYRALSRKYHPDRVGDNERIREINAAYEVLRDPSRRQTYDDSLRASQQQGTSRQVTPGHLAEERKEGAKAGAQMKGCPDCAEAVPFSAKVCRFCGHRFHAEPKARPRIPTALKIGCVTVPVLFVALGASGLIRIGGNGESQPQANPAPSILELLQAGSADVCASEEVQITAVSVFAHGVPALKTAFDKLIGDWEQGKVRNPVRFDAISLVGKKQDISEVSCRANVLLNDQSFVVDYQVRPAKADQDSFVVEAQSDQTEVIQDEIRSELVRLGRLRKPTYETIEKPVSSQSLATPEVIPTEYPDGLTTEEKRLYDDLNDKCRGGSGDDPATMEYCARRDAMWNPDV